jgi:hypothetical protein
MLLPQRIQRWLAQEQLARAIASQCDCPENRARWAAMAEQWAVQAQIEATLMCREASVPLRLDAPHTTREITPRLTGPSLL